VDASIAKMYEIHGNTSKHISFRARNDYRYITEYRYGQQANVEVAEGQLKSGYGEYC